MNQKQVLFGTDFHWRQNQMFPYSDGVKTLYVVFLAITLVDGHDP